MKPSKQNKRLEAPSPRITTKGGLLWQFGKVISLPRADSVAISNGFTCAEQYVKSLEEKQLK